MLKNVFFPFDDIHFASLVFEHVDLVIQDFLGVCPASAHHASAHLHLHLLHHCVLGRAE